jgi:hypothetical protein
MCPWMQIVTAIREYDLFAGSLPVRPQVDQFATPIKLVHRASLARARVILRLLLGKSLSPASAGYARTGTNSEPLGERIRLVPHTAGARERALADRAIGRTARAIARYLPWVQVNFRAAAKRPVVVARPSRIARRIPVASAAYPVRIASSNRTGRCKPPSAPDEAAPLIVGDRSLQETIDIHETLAARGDGNV